MALRTERAASAIATAVGAAGSLGLLLHAAGAGVSLVLIFVMAIWTLAPFAALEMARRLATRRSNLYHGMSPSPIFVLALVIATGTLLIYGVDAIKPLSSKAAFPFVVAPLISWALIAFTILTVRLRPSRKRGAE